MSKVKELNEIVVFGCRFAVSTEKVLEDKKVTVSDIALFISPLMAAGDAFQDAKIALEEFKNLDAEGIKLIEATIESELGMTNAKVKKIAKKIISASMGIYLSYKEIAVLLKDTESVAI